MNNQPQSKVCPRCRFMLSKTYSQKMICKRCGYTTNKLQIVAEEDTFNTNIKFSKRVTLKPDKVVEQQTKSEDNLQTYLKAYQAILRHLGSKFISSNIKESLQVRQKTAQTFKSLWFGYLQKMSKQGNPIAGIFTALMEKSQRKQQLKNRSTVKAQKQEQSDEGSSQGEENIKKDEQQSQRDNEQSSKRSLESQNEQSKSNRKKKSLLAKDETMREFKKIVNSLLKSIKAIKEDNPLNKFKQTCEKQLLQKLLTISRDKLQESSFASMTYLSDRYCWILGLAECFRNTKNNKNIKNNNNNKNNTNKNKNISNKNNTKQILQKKMQMKYVRQEELRQMCRQRGLSYQKRRLFGEMSILCYDLLQYWYRKENKISVSICENARYPYGYLLQTYKQTGNKPLIIQQLIKLLETMSQQVLIKQQQVTRKLPQLSLKFITSLIYLSCVINKQTFTILQVVNFSLQQLYKYGQEYMASSEDKVRKEMIGLLIKEKNMKVKRVKKVAHKLFSYLSQYLNNIPMCLEKWCNKYSLMFKLPQHISSQLLILTTTLYNSYIQQPVSSYNCVSTVINNNNLVNNFSERFIVLQQPQILLSSLIILLKLNYGLDKSQYPYLVNIGEVWKYIEENKLNMRDRQIQKIQFVNKLLQENQYCRQLFNLNLYNKNINININNNNLNINNKNITINFIDSNNGQSTISKSSPLCQSSFGLLGLVQNINKSLQQLNHINQLKYISKIQSKQLTGKISMFKSIITKKQNQQSSYLSLVYNLNLKHNNNTQNINSNNSINSNSSIVKPLMVKYVDKQQIKQRQLMIQGDGTKKSKTNTLSIKSNRLQLPQVFSDSKLITRVSLNSNLYRAIDYLQNRYNRFYINKHKLNQQNQLNRSNLIHLDRSNLMENNYTNLMENNHSKQVQKILQVQKIVEEQHQHSSSLSQSNNNNNNNKDNNNINDKNDNNINNNNNINKDDNNINNDEFVIQQYLDRAMGHYQIIYQPTINNLNQLQLKQLLTIVQSLSYSLNGQHTDCSDILQWFGYLQTVLKEYQN